MFKELADRIDREDREWKEKNKDLIKAEKEKAANEVFLRELNKDDVPENT